MSKKLIAVSAAFALALTGLVGIAPANATPSIAYTTATGTGTQADPYVVAVPHLNSLVAGTNALQIGVTSIGVGDVATVTITGTAKVTTAAHAQSALVNVSTLGASSATTTVSSGTSANFFVYQTSTAAASTISISVTKTASGTTSTTTETKFIKPSAGPAHRVANVVAPATLANGSSADVTFNVTDVFGNVLEVNTAAAAVAGPTVAGGGVASWDATRKLNVARVTSTTNNPFIITIDGNGGNATDGPANSGLGGDTLNTSAVVNNTGVSAQVATLTAQVASLTAQLANSRAKDRSVTKKKYNTLARKWNAANPSARVALKK